MTNPRGIMVAGTDTGVGKTIVTAGLARVLADDGLDVGVMKPVETGWPADQGPWPADAALLREAARVDDPPSLAVPWAFEPPVAPFVAGRYAEQPNLLETISSAFGKIAERHAFTLVEGAGGLSVGLQGAGEQLLDYADLALELDLPLLIVGRAHLGTLNHCYLTEHYARSRGCRILGFVLNGLDPGLDDPSARGNPALIEERSALPVWGVLPQLDAEPTVESAAALIREHFDLGAFRRALSLPSASSGDGP
jgi:dethiobiotin synthetase